jgi:cell shape-determining protein MreC
MSYLLDKKEKQKKILKVSAVLLALLLLFYFRTPVGQGLSALAHFFFRPVWVAGGNAGERISGVQILFQSKRSLSRENEALKLKLDELSAKISNHASLLDENLKLKESLGRIENRRTVLAAILAKPNRSPYDTLVIDAGLAEGVRPGSLVTAFGAVPIGRVEEVFQNSSRAVLFSSPGAKTEVLVSKSDTLSDIFLELVGRGGGNFEMILPRDLNLEIGTEVHLPGLVPHTVGVIEAIISDPRDPYQKALLVAPVNIQELKFVEIETN